MGIGETTIQTSPTTLNVVVIFLTALNCLVVGLRLYTRQFLGQTLKIDDWFALVGYVFVLTLTVYFSIGISNQYVGYPVPADFTGEEFDPILSGSLQHFYVTATLLFPTLFFTKCTFILFYRRVLVADTGNRRDWANIVVHSSLLLVLLWALGFGLAWIFVCTPIKAFWSFPYDATAGTCHDTWMLNKGISVSDFVLDVLILVLPVPMVWRLHLPIWRKIAVLTVFFLGAIAVAASVIRMVVIYWATSSEGAAVADGLLVNSSVLFWALVEAELCLLAACLPTLRGLLKTRTVDSFLKSLHRSRTWIQSKSGSSMNRSKSAGDHDTLPLTDLNSSPLSGRNGQFERARRDKFPHDVTLATMDSVTTKSDMSQVH